jgi:hypothetical protein
MRKVPTAKGKPAKSARREPKLRAAVVPVPAAALRQRLLALRVSRLCLADWGLALGVDLRRVRPLLAKCIGEMAKSFPAPDSGLRLRVDPREEWYLAHPESEFTHDAEDQTLSEADVQLWQLDWEKVEAEHGMGQGLDLLAGKPIARVIGDFQQIELPSGRVMVLYKKFKRRAFLRAAHGWCEKNKTDVFPWQTVIDDYNLQFKDLNRAHRKIVSERIDDDLFKGQKDEFDELFGEPDRANGRLEFKVKLVLSRR